MTDDTHHHDNTPPNDWDDTEDLDDEAREERERIRVRLGLATAAPPRIIDGRYQVLARQGQGGMGVVFRAHDTRLDRDVALKLVRPRPFADEDRLRERLEREAKALARLSGHDHVVAVYDVGRHQDRIYFTMPYVDGPDLRQWQDLLDRSIDEILDVYLQAARGLAAAHQLGIVHRDFKPANVLIRAKDQRVMVADFGIAEAVSKLDTPSDDPDVGPEDPRLTATGAVLGTLPYVAPERIPGVDQVAPRAAPASDQFSFCVALWEALAGQVPFPGKTAAEMLAALECEPVGIKRIPRWLRPVLRQGLACDPDDRFPSMTALIRAIEHERFRGRRIAIACVGLAVVLGLTSAAFFTSSPSVVDDRPACSSFADSAARVWNDERKQALERHREYAPETTDHVIAQLDALMDRWVSAAQETCVDGYAPAPEDPRLVCLDQWLFVADEYVGLLVDSDDPRAAAQAGAVVDRLLPPTNDFCAFSPPHVVNFELWSLTELARAAATLGSGERALALADQSITMANTLANGQPYTAELAEAHSARAEVLTRLSRFAEALPEFEVADVQAGRVDYLEREISSRALWAKARVLDDEGPSSRHAIALEDIRRASLLLPGVFPLEQRTRLEAELADAAGYVEYDREAYAEARGHHEHAIALLTTLDLPVLLAKSFNNLGAVHHVLEQPNEAISAYVQARQILDTAAVPASHSTSIEVEFNLGNLMVELDRPEGFDHLDRVVRYTSGEAQLEALRLALTLATNSNDKDRMGRLADDIFSRISSDSIPSMEQALAKYNVAIAWILLDDPRGDALFDTLDELPPELSTPELLLDWRRSQVIALESRGRCNDAAKQLAELDEAARQHSLIDDTFLEWRLSLESRKCRFEPLLNQ